MSFFDKNGDIDRYGYNKTVIGINIKILKNVPYAVGMCFGESKVPAILGAVAGGYINVLITDLNTARLLKHAGDDDPAVSSKD